MQADRIIEQLESGKEVAVPVASLDVILAAVSHLQEEIRLDLAICKGIATLYLLGVSSTVTHLSTDMARRAFEIADESMVELITSHAVPIGHVDSHVFGLVSETGSEVTSLSDADPAIGEAFEWLKRRELACLAEDAHGVCIHLKAV